MNLASAISLDIEIFGMNISISFWAKRTDNTSGEAVVIGNSSHNHWSRLYFGDEGDNLGIESMQNGEEAFGDVSQDTNWHHYVITSRGDGGPSGGEALIEMYEDGASITSANTNFGNVFGKKLIFDRIGNDANTGTQEFKGLLHQLAIWTEVLDDIAVEAMYNSGSPICLQANSGGYINSGQLLHLWKFSENTGSTTADEIGGITGTFVGNTAFSTDIPS